MRYFYRSISAVHDNLPQCKFDYLNCRILKDTVITKVIFFEKKQNKKNSTEMGRYENAVFVHWMGKAPFT